MTRNELKIKLAGKLGIPQNQADKVILAFIGAIRKGVNRDGKAIIKHFGCFRAKDMPPFKYHNITTGEFGVSDPYRKLSFHAGKELTAMVNGEKSCTK